MKVSAKLKQIQTAIMVVAVVVVMVWTRPIATKNVYFFHLLRVSANFLFCFSIHVYLKAANCPPWKTTLKIWLRGILKIRNFFIHFILKDIHFVCVSNAMNYLSQWWSEILLSLSYCFVIVFMSQFIVV